MPVIVRGFQYYDLTNPIEAYQPGAAAFLGGQTLSGWGLPSTGNGIGIRTAYAIGLSNITLSGGATLYNMSVPQTLPTIDNVRTDTTSQSISTLIYNPVFIGKISEGGSIALCMYVKPDNNPTPQTCFYLTAKKYEQTPNGAAQSERLTWSYTNYAGSDPEYQRTGIENPDFAQYPLIKMYRTTIEEKEFYVVAVGVNAANQPVISSGMYLGTVFYAIPCVWFKDRLPIEYIGPEAEPDPETGFDVQPENVDAVEWAKISDTNPYGVNTNDGGLTVLLPSKSQYSAIAGLIYRGYSEGFFNSISQFFSSIVGGNTHRAAEEVNIILQGILSLHTVPKITTYNTTTQKFETISGYLVANPVSINSPGSQTVFEVTKTIPSIAARMGSFLDYEPYTRITLKLPFFNPVEIPASDFWEFGTNQSKQISCRYIIDILSGLLHVDVKIKEHLIFSMSTSVKTEIPIIGSGSNGGNLAAITKAISSTAELAKVSGGNPITGAAGIVSGGLSVAETVSTIHEGVTIGKGGFSGLAPMLEPRQAYLIITTPKAAIPKNHISQIGMMSKTGYDSFASLKGWNVFESIDLSAVDAPQEIKQDIINRLRQGVFIE